MFLERHQKKYKGVKEHVAQKTKKKGSDLTKKWQGSREKDEVKKMVKER